MTPFRRFSLQHAFIARKQKPAHAVPFLGRRLIDLVGQSPLQALAFHFVSRAVQHNERAVVGPTEDQRDHRQQAEAEYQLSPYAGRKYLHRPQRATLSLVSSRERAVSDRVSIPIGANYIPL